MKFAYEPVSTYIKRALCDCGGELRPTGIVLDSYPPIYPHKCAECGDDATLDDVYPKVVHQ